MHREENNVDWGDAPLLEQLDCLNEDVPAMPENFHTGWMQKVEENAMLQKNKTPLRTIAIRALSTAAAAIFIIGGAMTAKDNSDLFTAGGYSGGSEYGYRSASYEESYDTTTSYDDGAYDGYALTSNSMLMSAKATGAAPAAVQTEKKIIRSASLTIGTQTYQESLDTLKERCETSGGWIESFSENTNYNLRVAYLTLRIPSEKLDEFLEGSALLGRVTRRSESARDDTDSYQDTAARLNTQQALMARLLSLVTDAADLSDLLELESQIADTQYTIDRLQSSLNSIDRQVDYSTVDVTLREESPATDIIDTEKTLWERLQAAVTSGVEAFGNFVENAFVYAAAALPFVGVVLLVWGGAKLIQLIVKKWRKKV